MKIITVETNADGEFTYERRVAGIVLGIAIDVGTLTTPDIAITDGVWDTDILSVTALAADATYQPLVAGTDEDGDPVATLTAPAIYGSLKVVVTGGGANFTGTIRVLFA